MRHLQKNVIRRGLGVLLAIAMMTGLFALMPVPMQAQSAAASLVELLRDRINSFNHGGATIDLSDPNPPADGDGWTFSGNIYTIHDTANVTVTGTSTNGRRLAVATDATANITLSGANIEVNFAPLWLYPGANLTLTLEGSNILTAGASNRAGIFAPDGTTLTIGGEGSLTAQGHGRAAGIGGNGDTGGTIITIGGTITINDGTVTATGGNNGGAGIGGGRRGTAAADGGNGGTTTINGGDVTATGNGGGAGIGGGFDGAGGDITISGGNVTATGNAGGAGIGGGHNRGNSYGTVTITGGTVTATGNGGGAGIGGGANWGGFRAITITGGNITAIAGGTGNSAAIGKGSGNNPQGPMTILFSGRYDFWTNTANTPPAAQTGSGEFTVWSNTLRYIRLVEHTGEIETAEHLAAFAAAVNSGLDFEGETITLMNNIDLSGIPNWTPIGNANNHFRGTFNGGGFTVTGLTINSANNFSGLFGAIGAGGIVRDLTLENVNITGGTETGAIAGFVALHGLIENSLVSGEVSGDSQTGGIVGDLFGTVSRSGNHANVTATGTETNSVGGIAGRIRSDNNAERLMGRVEYSFNTGDITNTSATDPGEFSGSRTGGIAGEAADNNGANANSTSIVNSYNTGNITGTGYFTGGITGYAWRTRVDRSFNTGTVRGGDNATGSAVGGTRFANSGVSNTAVLNDSVTGGTATAREVNRLNGWLRDNSVMTNNFARIDMFVRVGPLSRDYQNRFHGQDAFWPEFSSADWWENTLNFAPAVWEMADGILPMLRDVKGQSPVASALIGTATIDNTAPRVGDVLTGSLAGGNNTGNLTYRWLADGVQVQSGPGATYTVRAADLGKVITLEITSDVQTGTRTSAATAAVYTTQIATAEALVIFAEMVNSGSDFEGVTFTLVNNIDLSTIANWTPIGTATAPADNVPPAESALVPFRGSFDGGDFTISGLTINNPTGNFQGLFGVIGNGGSVKNLTLENVDITGGRYTGGVAGFVFYGGSIENVFVSGEVSGDTFTGGVTGHLFGTVTRSGNSADVTAHGATTHSVGGIVGRIWGGDGRLGRVSRSFNTGNITNTSATTPGGWAGSRTGGIAGVAEYQLPRPDNFVPVAIENSFNTGEITGTGDFTGGVIGYVWWSQADRTFNTGEVQGGTANTGGITGFARGAVARVSNSAALNNSVSGTGTAVNRICGTFDQNATLVNNRASADMEVNGDTVTSSDANSAHGADASLQNINSAAWWEDTLNFAPTVWEITGGILPVLRDVKGQFPVANALLGTVTIDNTAPRVGDVLTGSLVGGNNTGELTFRWLVGGMEVQSGPGATYTVRAEDLGKVIALEITSSVQTGTITRAETATVFTTQIATAEALAITAGMVNSGNTFSGVTITLMNDIDLSGSNWTPIGTATALGGTGDNLAPPADSALQFPFRGSFDGGGYTIRGLTINTDSPYQGLFGVIGVGGSVKNLTLENVDITGGRYTGGVAGFVSHGGSIENVLVSGAVSGTSHTGGITGHLFGTVTRSGNSSNVTAHGAATHSVGGIVGRIWGENGRFGRVSSSFNTGNVTNTSATNPGGWRGSRTGGIAGVAEYQAPRPAGFVPIAIENSFNTGDVTGIGSFTGGVVGYVWFAQADRTFNTGAVQGGTANTGGITGFARGAVARVSNSAALNNSVSGTEASRISGPFDQNATLVNNRALANMTVNGSALTGSLTDRNGADTPWSDFNSAAWWENTLNLAPAVWEMTDGILPMLRGVSGQIPIPVMTGIFAPDAPVITNLTPGDSQITVEFTPPANDGGSPITRFTVTVMPGNITVTGTSSPITVTGLTSGEEYTFTVTATNSAGTGPHSAVSGPATPTFVVPPTAVPNIAGHFAALLALLMLSATLWVFALRRKVKGRQAIN